MSEYYQLVYCHCPPYRIWRRKINIVSGGAVVADGEIMLPEKVREAEGRAGEVLIYRGPVMLRAALSQHGCLYCKNTSLAVCGGCGRIVCVAGYSSRIWCYWCEFSGNCDLVDEEFFPISRSGYTAWSKGRKMVWANGGARELRAGAAARQEVTESATTELERPEPVREILLTDQRTEEEKESSDKLAKWLKERRPKKD